MRPGWAGSVPSTIAARSRSTLAVAGVSVILPSSTESFSTITVGTLMMRFFWMKPRGSSKSGPTPMISVVIMGFAASRMVSRTLGTLARLSPHHVAMTIRTVVGSEIFFNASTDAGSG